LGIFYLGSVINGFQYLDSTNAPYGAMFIPVFGPLIVAAQGNFHSITPGFINFDIGPITTALYLSDFIAQAGGVTMLVAGLASKKKILLREDLAQVVRPEVFVGPGSVRLKLTF